MNRFQYSELPCFTNRKFYYLKLLYMVFRSVTHLQFLEWPSVDSCDILPSPELFPKHAPFLSFVRTVRHFYSLQSNYNQPVLLQCKYDFPFEFSTHDPLINPFNFRSSFDECNCHQNSTSFPASFKSFSAKKIFKCEVKVVP